MSVETTRTAMAAATGTKRTRDQRSKRSLKLSKSSNHGETQHEDSLAISKHSMRDRKRTKLKQLRENRRIHKAVAAIEVQLASFEESTQHNYRSFQPEASSTSFSGSSYSFFETTSSQREESGKNFRDSTGSKNITDECELAALARSLHLEESSLGGRSQNRRRGGISVVMAHRR
jgi:hypothetical protein